MLEAHTTTGPFPWAFAAQAVLGCLGKAAAAVSSTLE